MLWPSLRSGRRSGSELAERGREDPFGALMRQVEDVFEDFQRNWSAPGSTGTMGFAPRLDVSENDGALVLTAELPGVDEKDVEVMLAGNVLTIKGEKRQERKEDEGERHLVERVYGSFQRSLRLPFEIEADRVEANFAKGVLTVTLPKPPEAKEKVKRIAVASG